MTETSFFFKLGSLSKQEDHNCESVTEKKNIGVPSHFNLMHSSNVCEFSWSWIFHPNSKRDRQFHGPVFTSSISIKCHFRDFWVVFAHQSTYDTYDIRLQRSCFMTFHHRYSCSGHLLTKTVSLLFSLRELLTNSSRKAIFCEDVTRGSYKQGFQTGKSLSGFHPFIPSITYKFSSLIPIHFREELLERIWWKIKAFFLWWSFY